MNPTHHTCCDCGYVWPHGADASHSCVRRLVAALAEQRQVTSDAITGALASGAQGSPAPEPEHWLRPFYDIGRAEGQRTQELAMLVRMLASSLKRHAPESNLVARATNYLAAKGLAGTPLRDAPASVEQAGGDRWDALQSIMEWTAAENIPDDRKLCLIRNAARAALAQAEAERPELWAVHAQGPDELYAAFTREDAEKHAAELNALPMPEGIAVGAMVVPSPWPEAEHWKYLAEQEREHVDVARAALAHAPTSSASPSCKWTESSGIWETGCGQTWSFIEDGPAENGALFCHHCGGRLVLIKSDDQEDDGHGAMGDRDE
ncbi:hypothetical protein [Pseudomonas aeruginosa]|uniref:hypothetical protein n=1 Tax=Pseudomonas aeruginosa TaxID=287 RepID=UPI003003BFEA|nr:hypothetical protein [Pseudomonas aeruginosa]